MREKPSGRKSKFDGTIPKVFNVNIPDMFADTYDKITRLSDIDDNQEFLDYCIQVEKVNLEHIKMNKRSIYIRWILTKHVISNLNKVI